MDSGPPVATRTRSRVNQVLLQNYWNSHKEKKRKISDNQEIERMKVQESSASGSQENDFVDVDMGASESEESESDDHSLETETKIQFFRKKTETFKKRRKQKSDNGDLGIEEIEIMEIEGSSSGSQGSEFVDIDASESEESDSGDSNDFSLESEINSQFLGEKIETLKKRSREAQIFGEQKSVIGKLGSQECKRMEVEESSSGSQEIEFVEIPESEASSEEEEEDDDDDAVLTEAEVGSINNPFDVDGEEDLDNSSSSHGKYVDYCATGSKSKERNVKEKKVRQSTRKRRRGYNDLDVVQILANSMFNTEEGPVLDEEIVEIVEPVIQPSLPLKFTFGVQETILVERTEDEKEMDKLWAEMALALYADGTTDDPMQDENEGDLSANEPASAAANCRRGKHCFVLDEEIGIICKFCSFVEKEIRHYTVPFCKYPFKNSERRDSYQEHDDIFDKFYHQDMDYDAERGSEFCSHMQGTVWNIIPGIGRDLHPHQLEGFEFLWKNIGGGIYLDKLAEPTSYDGGSGCIISHAPGTGKTRLAIVFLQTYMKLYPTSRPVIIAPQGLLLSWEAEFKKWNFNIPFHNLNQQKFSGKETATARRLINSGQQYKYSRRMVKLYSWQKDISVLGLSYNLFEKLVGDDDKSRAKEYGYMRKILLEFPGLLVLDEGHTPRNDQSLIWKALSRIQTKKRIILSGTPFQNNFYELFNTLCLVRPQFGDAFSKNSRKSGKNASRSNWSTLINPIGKESIKGMKAAESLEELRAMIRPFVHIHRGNILQQRLPGLRDAVVILKPGQLQNGLLDRIRETKKVQQLKMDYSVSVVSVHPSLVPKDFPAEYGKFNSIKMNPEEGVKTKFLMELIRISEALNEKVLVFSQYLKPLKLIGKQLAQQFKWIEGKEILHLQGSVDTYDRYAVIKRFNDGDNESKVLLASTRACSEGINLVGASRVVLLDVVWNPSVERQAICRAYRLGQKKVVYVYHLIISGSTEEEKYSRQGMKERLSNLVFYSSEKTHNHRKMQANITDDKKDTILEAMVERGKLKDILKEIRYSPKGSTFDDCFG